MRNKPNMEKVRKADIKRDDEFRAFLTKELDMEAAPASYHDALRRVYAELPRDMPVRHYPFRSAMKSLATVAVLLVVFGASLLGANRAYPQLTESLPGVGMIFRAINGTEDEESNPLPETVQVIQTRGGLHKIPAFEPVTAESPQGSLTIENAWSDGEKLYLDVSVLAARTIMMDLVHAFEGNESSDTPPQGVLFLRQEDVSHLQSMTELNWSFAGSVLSGFTINGQRVEKAMEPEQGGENFYLEDGNSLLPLLYDESTGDADDLRYTGLWVLEVPEGASGESLAVGLDLTASYGVAEGYAPTMELPLAFYVEFAVEVDQNFAVDVEASEPDNNYLVEDLHYTPGQFTAQVSTPYMGHYGYSLLPDSFTNLYAGTPYGIYAELTDPEGNVLYGCALEVPDEHDGNTWRHPPTEFTTLLKPADREKLILTLYQFDPQDLERLAMEVEGFAVEEIVNPVMAEFTLDLEKGTAAPSEEYAKENKLKLESTRPLKGYNHPAFERVYLYVQGVDTLHFKDDGTTAADGTIAPLVEIVINNYMRTDWPASWALECLTGGEVVQTVYGCDLEELEATVGEDFEGIPVYESEGGSFWQQTDGLFEPNTYLHVFFQIDYPEGVTAFDTMRLVDIGTGEVLIEDIEASYQRNLRGVLTASMYQEDAANTSTSETP